MTQELLYDKRGDIGWITFNRPAQRNALTFAMYEGLAETCGRIAGSGEVKALVITGAGDKAFAAGTDIAQFQDFKDAEDGVAYERKMDRILDTIERCGFPIARTLGNCLSMANYARLAALIGPQRVKEMLLLAKMMDGPTARDVGLVSELLPDTTALHARAAELAQTVASHAPITLRVTKEALRRLQARLGDENIDDLIRLAYGSADFREGMAAFLGKRAPKWTGL
jgi:enoyl-CoA hydratase/carnithine racemase